jgi:hypothetical protein
VIDFNTTAGEKHSDDERTPTTRQRYVPTAVAHQAVQGREAEAVRALGIRWHGRDHIRCPYPTHDDKNPSWRLMEDGHAVCSCTPKHSVFDVAMHLEGIDFEAAKIRVMEAIGRTEIIVDPAAEKAEGLTLAAYSAAKQLPIDRLTELGVRQSSYGQVKAAVRTPYFRLNGDPSVRFRINLNGDKKKRHYWRNGDKACLYGEWWITEFRAAGYVILVEGESDCQTCWFNAGFPALGLPGAGQWNEDRDAPLVADIPVIFAVIEHNGHGEPDDGGKVLLSRLARSSMAPRVRLIHLPTGIKDPSALYLKDPDGFPGAFRTALDTAQPIPQELIEAAATEKPPAAAHGVSLEDFFAYMPMHNYIFTPTRSMWPAGSVNARIPPIPAANGDEIKAATWLDYHKPVEQMTWAPGLPMIIRDRLIHEGGWIDRKGVSCFNLYLPPTITGGDPSQAGPWLGHLRYIYPDHADHILDWLAHRVQKPEQKINHALVLGGKPGIGKDTTLEPGRQAIGAWNFQEVSPSQITGRFNGYLKSVILRISEARDTGDVDRYQFYEHTKIYIAAPPDMLRIDEKNIKEYSIFNCTGVIITTNHKTDGLYLPHDDRRHYVAWSELEKEDSQFQDDYWKKLWAYYEYGGFAHVAAYLRQRDISGFDPKAPPPKTDAFWAIVDSNRSLEEPELADVLDALGRPAAVTLASIQSSAAGDFADWIRDRKNRRAIPHKLESCGYVAVRNPTDKSDGRWKVDSKRQVIYAKAELSKIEQVAAASRLAAGKPHPWQSAGP